MRRMILAAVIGRGLTYAEAAGAALYRVVICSTLAVPLAITSACAPDYEATRFAAEQGDREAQFTLAEMYQNGEGVERDDAEAVRWFHLAAEQGHADAHANLRMAARQGDIDVQFSLGEMYENGEGVPQDDAEAARWYRMAAEQGLAAAQIALGNMYRNSEGVLWNSLEAIRWYRLAAEQGHAAAQIAVATMHENGEGVPQDSAEAIRWYRLAAEQGHAEAQATLGSIFKPTAYSSSVGALNVSGTLRTELGDGMTQDYAEAVRWYRLAGEQGHAEAQATLGSMYRNGEGVAQDYAEAVRWYRLAGEQGHADAQATLGSMYENGEGVAQDDSEAVRWYRLAGEQSHADAQASLGSMYGNGEGVAQDYAEAVRWYRLAGEQGHADAQASLGSMYENGEGVAQDDAEAVRWYVLADEQGHADALANLQGVAAEGNAAARRAVSTLRDLELSEGPPERGFTMAAMLAGVIPPGDVSLVPALEPGVIAYSATVSQPQLTIRAKAVEGMTMRVTGTAAGGALLENADQSTVEANDAVFISVTLSGLTAGENTIRISNDGSTYSGQTYVVAVTRGN